MNRLATVLLVGVCAATVACQEQASKDGVRVKAAVDKTRAQKSYSVSFEAVIRVPDSDPMKINGETVWVAPGVLFTNYTASGGEMVRLLRVGEKVWLYHVLAEEWLPDSEVLTPTAKLKRRAVTARYATVIDSLYP